MRVGSVGCGNVGLNTLRACWERGHEVAGVDPAPGAAQRLADRFGAAAALPTLDRLSGFDVVFLCVPTEPIDGTGAADLSIIEGLVENFAGLERHPWWRPPVLVQRSTCPPGTAARLSGKLRRTAYAVNPSFLAKSTQWLDSDCPSRIAYAGPSGARALLARLYSGFPGSPCFASDSYEAVELLKYIENSIDAVLISLWNEFLCLADALGVSRSDFLEVLRATPDRDRFATTVRVPGGAFGLGCLPKDLRAIVATCAQHGTAHHVLRAALLTNADVSRRWGGNHLPTSELLHMSGGRVSLTSRARDVLGGADQRSPAGGPV